MDSDDYTTDEGKRKKGMEDLPEGFIRSKRIQRTPVKITEIDDKWEKIMKMLESLTTEVKELRKEQKEFRDELKEIRKENEVIKNENLELKAKIKKVEERLERIEKDKRRNNIVLQGLKLETEDRNTLKERVENFLKTALKVEINTTSVRKLNDKMCIVELENGNDKQKIMKRKAKLREIKDHEIYINDDLSKMEREIQRKIRNVAKTERARGKRVKIGFQKVVIDDVIWKWEKEKQQLEKNPTFFQKN